MIRRIPTVHSNRLLGTLKWSFLRRGDVGDDETAGTSHSGGLRKDLSTFSLTALIMGAMIGSGIFFLPGIMLDNVESAGINWPSTARSNLKQGADACVTGWWAVCRTTPALAVTC